MTMIEQHYTPHVLIMDLIMSSSGKWLIEVGGKDLVIAKTKHGITALHWLCMHPYIQETKGS
jgi:hypothetical protein